MAKGHGVLGIDTALSVNLRANDHVHMRLSRYTLDGVSHRVNRGPGGTGNRKPHFPSGPGPARDATS